MPTDIYRQLAGVSQSCVDGTRRAASLHPPRRDRTPSGTIQSRILKPSLRAAGLAWGSQPKVPHARPHPLSFVFASLLSGIPAAAQERGFAHPNLVLKEGVTGMPRGDKQEVRVLTASFKPGERMVFHRHRSPVTVVILEGAVTLDSGGCWPLGNSLGA